MNIVSSWIDQEKKQHQKDPILNVQNQIIQIKPFIVHLLRLFSSLWDFERVYSRSYMILIDDKVIRLNPIPSLMGDFHNNSSVHTHSMCTLSFDNNLDLPFLLSLDFDSLHIDLMISPPLDYFHSLKKYESLIFQFKVLLYNSLLVLLKIFRKGLYLWGRPFIFQNLSK